MFDYNGPKTLSQILSERAGKPTTLNAAIEQFLSDLLITDTLSDRAASRQQSVRAAVEDRLKIPIDNSYLVGSYARNTQISEILGQGIIDVDCLLILKQTKDVVAKYYSNTDGGARILNELRDAINGYQGLRAEVSRPCVTLTWADMKMEMTPSFELRDGGYFIPSNEVWTFKWQETDPIKDGDLILARNKEFDGRFKHMVRMIKCWNRNFGKPFSSFGLEALAYITTNGFRGLDVELPHFFRKLHDYIGYEVPAPSEVGSRVHLRFESYRKHYILTFAERIQRAFYLGSIGQHQEAIALMGSVFGKPFPGVK